jgi:hydroxymethylpyrimidine/phosphomethylpyrimidine kinase
MQPPVALTIAGSDNSSGAGAQADLKTFTAHGVYGLTAITCVVAEVPGKVSGIQPVEPAMIAAQIELSFGSFPVAALKTGMLHSREVIAIVCSTLEQIYSESGKRPPLVVDPVMVATSGDPLLQEDAVESYQSLFRLAALVTPNLDELGVLTGRTVSSLKEMREAGNWLVEKHRVPFLIKGGHLKSHMATDLLIEPGGRVTEFSESFVPGVSTHGTGCTYAAAITASLAYGGDLRTAVGNGKRFVTRAIERHFRWEEGGNSTFALNHFAF